MPTEGTKLLAPGAVVTLKDGVERRLVLDMEALVVIEERVGSLSTYVEGLNRNFRGPLVKSVLAGLEAGLRHYRVPLTGEPQFTRSKIVELMVFGDVPAYSVALDAAWAEHIPTPEKNGRGKGSRRVRRSRGQSSTVVPQSFTEKAERSSGA